MQYMGMFCLSSPISLSMIVIVFVLHLIIIINFEVWLINHCSGLGLVLLQLIMLVRDPVVPKIYGYFYASAFRRRRHYVFGSSVRPSVRSLKYPLLTCTWVRWSTRPTVTVLWHVRPSVRLSVRPSVRPSVRRGFRAFAGECMEGLAWNFTCWCILTTFRTD